jgi:hypothetical protein
MLVYREMNGSDWKKVREMTATLDGLLAERGVTQRRPLAVFYPDGRAEIGFAVEGAAPILPETQSREIPRQRYMVARFPWRNQWSYLAGYFKVDPALAKHRALHGYEKTEAYALKEGASILYFQPIVKRESQAH